MINSKAKGASAERELSNLLKTMGFDCRRGVQYQGGQESPDVIGIPGIHIECKRVERFNLKSAQQQAVKDAGNNVPTIWHRYNRADWWVMVPMGRLGDFCRLVLDELERVGG